MQTHPLCRNISAKKVGQTKFIVTTLTILHVGSSHYSDFNRYIFHDHSRQKTHWVTKYCVYQQGFFQLFAQRGGGGKMRLYGLLGEGGGGGGEGGQVRIRAQSMGHAIW